MKSLKALPPLAYLRECFLYDPETGELKWKERPREHFRSDAYCAKYHRKICGKTATFKTFRSCGKPCRLEVKVAGGNISATRIIYALMGVEIPEGMIPDHKNRDPFDNRWGNLRLATYSQNSQNKKNKRQKYDLPKGVHVADHGKFVARCMVNGRDHYLGRFPTPESAKAAYDKAVSVLHGDFVPI